MDKRKSQSINNKKKLVTRSTELSKVLDNPKNSIENLNEFKKGCFLLFNKMLNGFALHKIILDKEGKPCDYRFLEVNPAFEKLTGLKRAEILGKTVLEVLPGLQPYWIDTYGKVAMTGKSVQSEHYSQPLSKYYEVNVYSPKKGYFITIFSELEEESRIFKRYFEKYLEYASVLSLVLDKEGNINLINKKGVELLGYPKEEIIGKNWFMNFLPEKIRSETKKYFKKILRGEVPIDDYYENPVITKYGVKILRWQNTFLKDASGKIFGILSLIEDITSYKQLEEKLRNNEERLLRAQSVARMGFLDWNLKTNKIFLSDEAYRIHGLERQEDLTTPELVARVVHPDDVEFVNKSLKQTIQGVKEYDIDHRVVWPDGTVRWVHAQAQLTKDPEGMPDKLLGTVVDITERKKMEEEVLQEKAYLNQLVETAPESIVVTDNQGTVLRVNSEFVHMFGYEVGEAVGRNIDDLVALPGARKEARAVTEFVLKGEKISLETVRRRKDGTLIDVSIMGAPIQFKGKQAAVYAIYLDITRRKKAEEALLNSNKRLKKMYSLQNVIRKLNQFLLRCDNEDEIYKTVCDTFIEANIVKFVWIGLTEEGTFDVKPVACAGIEKEYIDSIKAKWDNSPLGNGPVGTAIKTYNPVIIGNIRTDPRYMPWGEEVLKRGYLSLISLPLSHEGKVIGVLDVYSDKEDAFNKEDVEFLKEITTDIAIGVKSIRLEKNLQKRNEQLGKAVDNIIFTMAKISESKDPYTAGHQERVSQLATAIARKMGLSEDRIESLKFASLIHDIGKISIPVEILTKPVKLSETEFALIKEHPRTCYNIIKEIDFPWEIAPIILQHHERLDGSGYPKGLKDKEILLESKILAVADVVEAMNSYRPYRAALGIDKALEEISKNKGKLYDSDVVDACIKLFKKDDFKFK